MRVLESSLPPNYTMPGKRKHKIRKQSVENDPNLSDSSDECAGLPSIGCQHVQKSVNFAAMKKGLKQLAPFGECFSCSKENQAKQKMDKNELAVVAMASGSADVPLVDVIETTIWLCLRCGHQGCDRNSREKHALKHYETPHSDSHAVVINLSTWVVWCYDCDDEVIVDSNKKLMECVDFLHRQSGSTHSTVSHAGETTKTTTEPHNPETERADTPDNEQKSRAGTTEQLNNVIKVLPAPNPVLAALPKVKGLNNLGNTCFFNAVMQNLSQTYELEAILNEYLKKGLAATLPGKVPVTSSDSEESTDEESGDSKMHYNLQEPLAITLPEGGTLSQSVLSFLKDMNSSSRNNSISPSGLFSQICKKAPRFKGFQQQDSHELLRTLMDGMRAEEVKRAQSGILRAFNLPDSVKPNKVDDETKVKIKEYGREAKHTFVENIFGGYFISTVLCEECHVPSQIFEPFLDVSLSISEEKPPRPNAGWGAKKKELSTSCLITSSQPDKPITAVDGFAQNAQESKHQKKKSKKEAKRDAKIARKMRKNKVSPEATSIPMEMSSSVDDKTVISVTQTDRDIADDTDSKKNTKDESNSNGEDEEFSDADVEDNLESDVSRNRFHCLDGQLNDNESDSGGRSNSPKLSELSPARKIVQVKPTNPSTENAPETVKTVGGSSCVQIEKEETNYTLLNGHSSDGTCTAKAQAEDHIGKSCLEKDNTCSIGSNVSQMQVKGHSDSSNREIADTSNVSVNDIDRLTKDIENIDLDCQSSSTTLTGSTISAISVSVDCNGELDDTLEEGADIHDEHRSQEENEVNSSSLVTHMDGAVATSKSPDKSQLITQSLKRRSEAITKAMVTLAPRYHSVSHECSVMSCLNQFTSAELLTGNNRFGCRYCTRRKHRKLGASGGKKETVYSNANKQVLLFPPPAVLTLHLKRFEQAGYSLRKVNKHVDFPLLLDLAPYCSSLCQGVQPGQSKVLYSLYGVVEHSGRLTGGHYTAYVKVRPRNQKRRDFMQSMDFNIKNVKLTKVLEERLPYMNTMDEARPEEDEAPVTIGKWFYISDSRVNEVTEQSVLKCQAYMLFYERVY